MNLTFDETCTSNSAVKFPNTPPISYSDRLQAIQLGFSYSICLNSEVKNVKDISTIAIY